MRRNAKLSEGAIMKKLRIITSLLLIFIFLASLVAFAACGGDPVLPDNNSETSSDPVTPAKENSALKKLFFGRIQHDDVYSTITGTSFAGRDGIVYDLVSFSQYTPYENVIIISGTRKAVFFNASYGDEKCFVYLIFEKPDNSDLFYYNGQQFFTSSRELPTKDAFDVVAAGDSLESLLELDPALVCSARMFAWKGDSKLDENIYVLLSDMSVLRFKLSEDRKTIVSVAQFTDGDLSMYDTIAFIPIID